MINFGSKIYFGEKYEKTNRIMYHGWRRHSRK